MINISNDKTISITRGDIGTLAVSAKVSDEELYLFKVGEIIRFKVCKKKNCDVVYLVKDIAISEETTIGYIYLDKDDTKLGDITNKPVDYWYEVELNPDTNPQTIIGYDDLGPKIFRLYPEGGDLNV